MGAHTGMPSNTITQQMGLKRQCAIIERIGQHALGVAPAQLGHIGYK